MAGEDDDVIVSLPPEGGEVKVTPAEPGVIESASFNDDPLEDLKGQFANMTAQLATTQQTAQQTARQLEDTTRRLAAAENEVVSSQLDTVLSGIAAADAEAASAEQAYVAAHEAGDGMAMARAQRVMAGAEARKQRLVEAKADLEDDAKQRSTRQPETRQQPPQQRQQPSHDPVEAAIANGAIPPKSAAWLRAHPECITDAKMNARMMAAHNLALAEDIVVESPEYFRRIEEGIKVAKPAQQQQRQQSDGRRPSSAAASAAGAAGGGLNGGGTEVRLTKGEATSATDGTLVWNYDDPSGKNLYKKGDPIGLAEMARRKHLGIKAGLYDRNNIEA